MLNCSIVSLLYCCLIASVCAAEELAGTDAAASALRGFTYQAIGQLAARAPALFRSDAAVAARFFGALSTERAGVRAALQEALSALATAHRGCSGAGHCQFRLLWCLHDIRYAVGL